MSGLVRSAGAEPRRLAPGMSVDSSRIDGLLLSGGADVTRGLYDPTSAPPSAAGRDAFELGLLARAVESRQPVLGICRGAQLLNVAAGGSLRDAAALRPPSWRTHPIRPTLQVSLSRNSRVAETLGRAHLRVSCLHQQAIDRLGRGLRVVGRDQFGIVQAIEARDHPFLIGVQWHPELLAHSAVQRRLIRALVGYAALASGRCTSPVSRPFVESPAPSIPHEL